MIIPRWLHTIFDPSLMQNLSLDELQAGLADSAVRRHWLSAVLEEIRDSNLRVHDAMLKRRTPNDIFQESARLQGIVYAMGQILNSKTSVELERQHNHTNDPYAGVAVQPIS